MNGHFDIAFPADGHQRLQKILQVFPELFPRDGSVGLKQFVQPGHPLRFPAGEGEAVEIVQDIVGHFLRVVVDPGRLIKQGGGAVPHGVEKIGAGPVEDRHKIVADHLYPEP